MPQTIPQYSAFSAAANELRQMSAENRAARLAEEQERARLERQALEDSWKERQLAVTERPEMIMVRRPDGSEVMVPKAPGAVSAAPLAPLVPVREGGRQVYRRQQEGLTSEDEPEFGFVRQSDGSEVYSRLGEGVVQAPAPRAPRTPNYEKLELIGPDGNPTVLFFDPVTGQKVNPDLPPGARLKTSTTSRPPTGEQSNALSFHNRMRDALGVMQEVEDQVTENDLMIINESPLPEFINQRALTDAGRRYVRALRQFTEARLRKESGAAINADEYAKDRQMAARQVVDSPKSLEDRRRYRDVTLEGLAVASGPAYEAYYGRPYEKRGSGTQRQNPWAPGGSSGAGGRPNPWATAQ